MTAAYILGAPIWKLGLWLFAIASVFAVVMYLGILCLFLWADRHNAAKR